MATKNEPTSKERAFLAAVQRFPQAEFAIRQLMKRSEAFCDMCGELAVAELALSSIQESPPALREARAIEWQQIVDGLVAEIRTALRESEARLRDRKDH